MKNNVFQKITIILVLLLSLSSCALMSKAPAYNPNLFTLNPGNLLQTTGPKTKANNTTVIILPVVANPELNTKKMAYVKQANQIAYFAVNRWAASPPQMLMPLIAQSLRSSGQFYAVVTAPFVGDVNLRLYTQLLQFQQDFTTTPSQFRMTVAAQLINSSGKIVGAKQFTAIVPAPSENPYGGVLAANQAANQILQQLTTFVIIASAK